MIDDHALILKNEILLSQGKIAKSRLAFYPSISVFAEFRKFTRKPSHTDSLQNNSSISSSQIHIESFCRIRGGESNGGIPPYQNEGNMTYNPQAHQTFSPQQNSDHSKMKQTEPVELQSPMSPDSNKIDYVNNYGYPSEGMPHNMHETSPNQAHQVPGHESLYTQQQQNEQPELDQYARNGKMMVPENSFTRTPHPFALLEAKESDSTYQYNEENSNIHQETHFNRMERSIFSQPTPMPPNKSQEEQYQQYYQENSEYSAPIVPSKNDIIECPPPIDGHMYPNAYYPERQYSNDPQHMHQSFSHILHSQFPSPESPNGTPNKNTYEMYPLSSHIPPPPPREEEHQQGMTSTVPPPPPLPRQLNSNNQNLLQEEMQPPPPPPPPPMMEAPVDESLVLQENNESSLKESKKDVKAEIESVLDEKNLDSNIYGNIKITEKANANNSAQGPLKMMSNKNVIDEDEAFEIKNEQCSNELFATATTAVSGAIDSQTSSNLKEVLEIDLATTGESEHSSNELFSTATTAVSGAIDSQTSSNLTEELEIDLATEGESEHSSNELFSAATTAISGAIDSQTSSNLTEELEIDLATEGESEHSSNELFSTATTAVSSALDSKSSPIIEEDELIENSIIDKDPYISEIESNPLIEAQIENANEDFYELESESAYDVEDKTVDITIDPRTRSTPFSDLVATAEDSSNFDIDDENFESLLSKISSQYDDEVPDIDDKKIIADSVNKERFTSGLVESSEDKIFEKMLAFMPEGNENLDSSYYGETLVTEDEKSIGDFDTDDEEEKVGRGKSFFEKGPIQVAEEDLKGIHENSSGEYAEKNVINEIEETLIMGKENTTKESEASVENDINEEFAYLEDVAYDITSIDQLDGSHDKGSVLSLSQKGLAIEDEEGISSDNEEYSSLEDDELEALKYVALFGDSYDVSGIEYDEYLDDDQYEEKLESEMTDIGQSDSEYIESDRERLKSFVTLSEGSYSEENYDDSDEELNEIDFQILDECNVFQESDYDGQKSDELTDDAFSVFESSYDVLNEITLGDEKSLFEQEQTYDEESEEELFDLGESAVGDEVFTPISLNANIMPNEQPLQKHPPPPPPPPSNEHDYFVHKTLKNSINTCNEQTNDHASYNLQHSGKNTLTILNVMCLKN